MAKTFDQYKLFNGDCQEVIRGLHEAQCVFADPFDNLGLKYNEYKDKMPEDKYFKFLAECLQLFATHAPIVWFSFYARWTIPFGEIAAKFLRSNLDWEAKCNVQVFTFGQHNQHDLGNNHRPLWRFKHKDAPIYPDQIRIQSWRQEKR